jgi:proteasome accessory factor A
MDGIEAILSFFVSRQVYTGAGHLAAKKKSADVPYQISQRADHFNRVFSDRTSEVRGIINIRKREVQQPGQDRRLHVIVGDCNMSEHAIGLKNGATAMVLRLLEEGALTYAPRLSSPVQALRQASRSMNTPLEMESGNSRYSALEIQAIYLDKVQQFFASRSASPEEKMLLALWEEVIVGLKKIKISDTWELESDPGELTRKIDWLLKLWLLNRYRTNSNLEWHDKRLKVLDFRYHDLDPATGLYEHCQAAGLVDRMVTDAEIETAISQPPQDTRACTRGRVIQQCMNQKIEVEIENWEKINIRTRQNSNQVHPFRRHRPVVNALEIKMPDPFQADHPGDMENVTRFLKKFG